MSHTPHELAAEFPEHAATIHRLKMEDHHFARLADDYHAVNRAIHRSEAGVEPMEDEALETLKKKRLAFADEIAAILAKEASAA